MLTAIILTKNEQDNIDACIQSLSWCDEIIVIDDYSADKTVDIAKKKGVKVFERALNNNFSQQRNYGISKAANEWVLFIDADERVSSALWYEIMQRTSESIGEKTGYYIKRQDTMWGKVLEYGETGGKSFLRLAKKDAGQWEGIVHEVWKINEPTGTLKNALDHFPHPNVELFLKEINYYTDLRSKELYKNKVKAYWWSPIIYPTAKFIVNYFFRLGFLDGIQGLLIAILMSFHSFLVRSKLWLLWQKN